MTLGNMRELGVRVIDVSSYSGDLKVLSSPPHQVSRRGRWVDVRGAQEIRA